MQYADANKDAVHETITQRNAILQHRHKRNAECDKYQKNLIKELRANAESLRLK